MQRYAVLLTNYLGILGKKSTGKFLFRDIVDKMENKKECYKYLSFTQKWKSYSPNWRVIDDLDSPDAFHTRIGERLFLILN